MGAGCYYTHKETGTKAFWIDIERSDCPLEDQDNFSWILESLARLFEGLGYYEKRNGYHFCNGLFELILESTYDGDGLVVRLEPHDDAKLYHLGMANHDRSYEKIKRTLLKAGYALRIASSGYTSTQIAA